MYTVNFDKIPTDVTDQDRQVFDKITSSNLSKTQEEIITKPPVSYPRQESVLAVHWHPEFIPMDLIKQRIDAFFPNRKKELIIPTQHNQIMSYGEYCGVEVDCYSHGFNLKVQLLIHFHQSRLEKAHVLKNMLQHTFRYRSSQLFNFIETLINPEHEDRLQRAAALSGADEDLIRFVQIYARKLNAILEEERDHIAPDMIKNKLIRNFFDYLRGEHSDFYIDHVQVFLKEVKKIVKANFNLEYFFRTEEVIEEARGIGAGIVIPHPEQFWPILLADYDVDGYEVWNPQSRQYTDFLIDVVDKKNRASSAGRRLLVLTGDDCHMSEKIKEPRAIDPEKSGRELGVQPVWDDLAIHNRLIKAGFDRASLIEEYRERLGS